MGEGYDQQLGTLPDSFHLESHELIGPLTQGCRGRHTLRLHQGVNLLAQTAIANSRETPWLHETYTRRQMSRAEQTLDERLIQRIRKKMPHVPSQGHYAVN